jgi:hypothetical protein
VLVVQAANAAVLELRLVGHLAVGVAPTDL